MGQFYHACPQHLSGLIRHIDGLGQAKSYWGIPYLDRKVMLDFYLFGVEVFIQFLSCIQKKDTLWKNELLNVGH